jgi:hypothetical protein
MPARAMRSALAFERPASDVTTSTPFERSRAPTALPISPVPMSPIRSVTLAVPASQSSRSPACLPRVRFQILTSATDDRDYPGDYVGNDHLRDGDRSPSERTLSMSNASHRSGRLFLFVLLFVTALHRDAPAARAADCDDRRKDIVVGGTVGFADMADPSNTARLRATCRVGLYLHDYIWSTRLDHQTQKAILDVFQDTGPQVVEIGATRSPNIFWSTYYPSHFINAGVNAYQAHVDGVGRLSLDQWKAYVDGGRAYGIKIVSPIFSPNTGQWKNAPFADPKWDDIRTEALYGGGITIDSPPFFFLNSQPGYQSFVEDEIRWARSSHIQATYIISPNMAAANFQRRTIALLNKLKADHALPDFYIVENYRPLPVDPNYLNAVGNEDNPVSINGVALWLAEHIPM